MVLSRIVIGFPLDLEVNGEIEGGGVLRGRTAALGLATPRGEEWR